MAVQIQCPHKGCMKLQPAWLDPLDNKVYCSLCEKEISNINHFIKIQLKTLKQYKPKKTIPFAVKCDACGKEDTPIIKNNNIVCSKCNDSLNKLTPIYKNMLKDFLNKKND